MSRGTSLPARRAEPDLPGARWRRAPHRTHRTRKTRQGRAHRTRKIQTTKRPWDRARSARIPRRILCRLALLVATSPGWAGGCSVGSHSPGGHDVTGKAGSFSRFAVRGDTLYALAGGSIEVFSLDRPEQPRLIASVETTLAAETLFRRGEQLYVGARDGMLLFDLHEPRSPRKLAERRHALACDPVVAKGSAAYVTVRSGALCGARTNELRVYDVSQPKRPRLVLAVPLFNPRGLGVDGDLLFVADGARGLKLFDVSDPFAPTWLQTLSDLDAHDVIPNHGTLVVLARRGVHELDYRSGRLRRLAFIPASNPRPGSVSAP